MDNLRGAFDSSDVADDSQDWNAHDEDSSHDMPPEAIGQDERRMQVRAYNHWASLLGDSSFPSIEDLEPQNLEDFGPNSVLLDFSAGIDDPAVQFLGEKLAEECGTDGHIDKLSDVPPRSLLSRITDHYMQILANEAPIGFEAEFVNQRGASIMYRGILLPFSSNDETIDFIYGVINWKEIADQMTADELLLEIDQALEGDQAPDEDEDEPHKHHVDTLVEAPSADVFELSPEDELPADEAVFEEPEFNPTADDFDPADNVAAFAPDYSSPADEHDLPVPDFGHFALDDEDEEDEDDEEGGSGYSFASLADYIEAPAKKAIDLDAAAFEASEYQPEYSDSTDEDASDDDYADAFDLAGFVEEDDAEPVGEIEEAVTEAVEEAVEVAHAAEPPEEDGSADPVSETALETPFAPFTPVLSAPAQQASEPADESGLYDCLASARELAETARVSEDRSRQTLYAAVGRAYDFSLAAKAAPQEYEELIEDSGLSMQERAPMTPVVKLVFGHDYDKTRLTEYAAVLSHAHRLALGEGTLAEFLTIADGGLKGVVAAERRLRKEEAGETVEPADEIRSALAKKLRLLEQLTLAAVSGEGAEFSLVMVRRDGKGGVSMVGEIEDDIALIERAARKLVG